MAEYPFAYRWHARGTTETYLVCVLCPYTFFTRPPEVLRTEESAAKFFEELATHLGSERWTSGAGITFERIALEEFING